MNEKPHFSSDSHEWETPQPFYDGLNELLRFNLDACATPENAKCENFYTREDDALKQPWEGRVWMNPPYGREIEAFMRKAYLESLKGATVVGLVPARTDTRWWQTYARRGEIFLLRGRLKFVGAQHSAPFPSAIVIFWGGILGEAVRPYGEILPEPESAVAPEDGQTEAVNPMPMPSVDADVVGEGNENVVEQVQDWIRDISDGEDFDLDL